MRKKSDFILRLSLIIGDALALLLSFAMAYYIRVKIDPRPFTFESQFFEFTKTVVFLVPIMLIILAALGLYRKSIFLGKTRMPERGRLFLAAVLSARDRLVLSYSNRELGSDAKLYPSSVVNDLKGALSQVISIDFKEFKGYPLTEFAGPIQTPDGQVWSAISGEQEEDCFKGLLPSLSRKAYALAGYDVANKNKIENKGADKEDVAQAEEALGRGLLEVAPLGEAGGQGLAGRARGRDPRRG